MNWWQIALLIGVAVVAALAGVFFARRGDHPASVFWRRLLDTVASNPISSFAVLCVAAIAVFLGYLALRLIGVLESPNWCGRAIQAERITPSATFSGLTSCDSLLEIQLKALALIAQISVSSYALTLLVLIIVVVAGARASAKLSMQGMELDVGRHGDPAVRAAEKVADAAVDEAKEIKKDAQPPEYNGPAMPEPKK